MEFKIGVRYKFIIKYGENEPILTYFGTVVKEDEDSIKVLIELRKDKEIIKKETNWQKKYVINSEVSEVIKEDNSEHAY